MTREAGDDFTISIISLLKNRKSLKAGNRTYKAEFEKKVIVDGMKLYNALYTLYII